MSILSTVTTVILLKTTNLGIYAVAGVSSIYWCIKMIVFTPINAAKNLRIKWNAFVSVFAKLTVCFAIIASIFTIIKNYTNLTTWLNFIINISIIGVFGYIITFILVLNKEEKKKIINMIKREIYKK